MLNENEIIESVICYLRENHFDIVSRANTNQKGDDIIAKRDDIELHIEAKGQTSSKEDSALFGQEFSSAQKKVHVSEAVYRALSMKEKYSFSGIALPKTDIHCKLINDIKGCLTELKIEVFFVDDNRSVQVENYSDIFNGENR